MVAARAVAGALAREGVLEIVQKGRVVPSTAKGPIRLRLAKQKKKKGAGAGAGGRRGGGGGGHG